MGKTGLGSQRIAIYFLLLVSLFFFIKNNHVFSAAQDVKEIQTDHLQEVFEITRASSGFINHIWIDPVTFEILPELIIVYGILRGNSILKANDCIKSTQEILHFEYENGRNKWKDQDFSQIPEILNLHRKFSRIGKLPDSISSLEKLIMQVNSGSIPEATSPLVDLYNAMSIKYGLPIVGEDLEKIIPIGEYFMIVKVSEGNEPYHRNDPFSDQPIVEFPSSGQIIYADQEGMISQALHWKENGRTLIDSSTKDAIFIAEATTDEEYAKVKVAMSDLGDLATSFCGAKFEIFSTAIN